MPRRSAVGLDIEDVLGDQAEVLRRANRRYSLNLAYEDVIEWDLEIGQSSFKPLIKEAMLDPDYVLGMRLHDGAVEMFETLHSPYPGVAGALAQRPPLARGGSALNQVRQVHE